MHAIVGVFAMDRATFAEQTRFLKERIVPSVQKSPGFVSGYWSYDHDAAQSHSYIVLDSEEAAQRFGEMVRGNSKDQAAHGVRLESLKVVEVLAEARK